MAVSPDPRTGKVELHNTWLVSVRCTNSAAAKRRHPADFWLKADIVKTYVDWAVKQGFAVIDVNLPKHVTDVYDSQEHEEFDTVEYRTKEATQLLTYIWDNYIELSSSTHVFLLGTNTGHGAVINFIKANEERAQEQLTTAISFVEDVPLQSCKSATDPNFAPWYHANSLVFVAPDHNFWTSGLEAKPKKRFGRISKSAYNGWNDMLIEQRDKVFAHMLRQTSGWERNAAEDDVMNVSGEYPPTSPKEQLPPVGNFALSPRPKNSVQPPSMSGVASPRGRQSRTPRSGSPTKAPLLGAFGSSPR